MNSATVFRDKHHVSQLISQINRLAEKYSSIIGRPLQIMEVCGGHTHAIYQAGLDQLLSDRIEFIHGPGCPVCVLPRFAIDQAISLAEQPGLIVVTFGDVLRVPGSVKSLQETKATGADVRVVYSPLDAIEIAKQNSSHKVVFFAIGFDTTMPGIARTIQLAHQQQISNLSFLCHHIRLMPTMLALLDNQDVYMDGFIGPGHVSVIIGSDVYRPIAERYHKPLVIAGFEPVDILQALLQLVMQLLQGRSEVENAYPRAVCKTGNPTALNVIDDVFMASDVATWRGLGTIAGSGVALRDKYRHLDAIPMLSLQQTEQSLGEPAYCGRVLTGALKPCDCPLFRRVCNPQSPQGALMVSSEGACSAYYRYKPQDTEAQKEQGERC